MTAIKFYPRALLTPIFVMYFKNPLFFGPDIIHQLAP